MHTPVAVDDLFDRGATSSIGNSLNSNERTQD